MRKLKKEEVIEEEMNQKEKTGKFEEQETIEKIGYIGRWKIFRLQCLVKIRVFECDLS